MLVCLVAVLCSQAAGGASGAVQAAPGQPYVMPDGTIPTNVVILPPQMAGAVVRPAAVSRSASVNEQASDVLTASLADDDATGRSPYFDGSQPLVQPTSQSFSLPVQQVQYPAGTYSPVAPQPYGGAVYPQPQVPFVQQRGQYDPYAPAQIFRPDQPRILARPDVVGDGNVAVEIGWQSSFFDGGSVSDPMFADIDEFDEHMARGLVRLGLTDRLELRLAGDLVAADVDFEGLGSGDIDGGGVDAGLKWKIGEQAGILPEFSVLGEVGYFEAEDEGTARGKLLGLAEWELGAGFAIGVSGGALFTGETARNDEGFEGLLSVSLEKRIGRGAIFGELAGVTNQRAYAQVGVLIPLGEHVFFDVHGGYAGSTQDIEVNGNDLGEVDLDGGFIGAGLTIFSR